MQTQEIPIQSEFIKLDSFLKFAAVADSGGMAKQMIQNGDVCVNGLVCTQRGKKLRSGDSITLPGVSLHIP